MKKFVGVLVAVLLLGLCAVALADVPIDSSHFPDPAFRQYIKEWVGYQSDYTGPAYIPQSKIDKTTSLSFPVQGMYSTPHNTPFKSLQGIEYFKNLEKLHCYNEELTSLDLSHNTKLTYVDCSGNQLTSLTLTGLVHLEYLYCYDNQLTSLNLESLPKLEELCCENNQLKKLFLKKNHALKKLVCDNNPISELNLTENKDLTELWCQGTQLSSLNLQSNKKLEMLLCADNAISSLDLTNNTALEQVECFNNKLSSLDIGKNAELRQLYCYGNQIKELDVKNASVLNETLESEMPIFSFDQTKGWAHSGNLSTDSSVKVTGKNIVSSYSGGKLVTQLIYQDNTYRIISKLVKGEDYYRPVPERTEFCKPRSNDDTSIVVPNQIDGPKGVGSYQFGHYDVTYIADNAFKGLKNLVSVELSSGYYDGGVGIGKGAFQDCVKLKNIYNNERITSIGSGAFKGCKALTSFKLSSQITSIEDSVFQNCSKLKTVSGGSNVKSIGASAFAGCKKLTKVPSFSKLTAIKGSAFKKCTALTKITIPSKVNSIGKSAFEGCKKLKTITIKTTKLTTKNVGNNAFKGISDSAAFKCPKSKLKAYKKLLIKKGAPKTCEFK